MQSQKLSRIVYISAFYDLIVTAPFASPWSARWLSDQLMNVHERLNWSGSAPSLSDPLALLFANLMGTIVLIWAVVRLRSPTLEFGLYDTVARVLFSSWMLYALLNGGSEVLVHFIVAEVSWAVVQGAALYHAQC